LQDRREPSFDQPVFAADEPERRGSALFQAADSDDRKFIVWLAIVIVGTAIGGLVAYFAARWYETRQMEAALSQFAAAVGQTSAQAQRDMAAISEQARRAQALERERAANEFAARQAAERRAREAEMARIVAADAEAARREASWQKFYVPSVVCKNADNRNTMQCANEHARAKKEFDKRWAAGVFR
jgi:hypothetical protein